MAIAMKNSDAFFAIFWEIFSLKLDIFPYLIVKIQVYIRSVADNIQSEAEQVKVVCGEPVSTGKMCLAKAPKATNVDLGRNNVEINLGKFFWNWRQSFWWHHDVSDSMLVTELMLKADAYLKYYIIYGNKFKRTIYVKSM